MASKVLQIVVELGERSYPIVIDSHLSRSLRRVIVAQGPVGRVFLVFDAQVFALHGQSILRAVSVGEDSCLAIPSGETAKTLRTVAAIYNWLIGQRVSRDDLIIGCGGGVTTDLVGYVASTVLRGVRWGALPTTLIGMTDAAIGGKTGCNHPRGKNCVGTFWQPRFVYGNTGFLQTLPAREWNAGFGEIVKYAGLIGEPMISAVSDLIGTKAHLNSTALREIISGAAAYKAGLVSADEHDTGVRMFLNLGHTFAHGIEKACGYGRIRHGEAVAIGLLASLNLAETLSPESGVKCGRYRSLVEQAVSLVPKRNVEINKVYAAMQLDKKRTNGKVRFVVLERPGRPTVWEDVPPKAAKFALAGALRTYRMIGGSRE